MTDESTYLDDARAAHAKLCNLTGDTGPGLKLSDNCAYLAETVRLNCLLHLAACADTIAAELRQIRIELECLETRGGRG